MSENSAAKIASKTNYELVQIIENKDQFRDEIILLTIQEMEKRGISHESLSVIKDNLIKSQAGKLIETLRERKQSGETITSEEVPALYSPQTIYFASILLNFLFGGILFLINLFKAKAKGKLETSIFIILFMLVEMSFLNDGKIDPVMMLVLNGVGGISLNMLFWKRYLGGKTYKRKSGWKVLLIAIVIAAGIIYLVGPQSYN